MKLSRVARETSVPMFPYTVGGLTDMIGLNNEIERVTMFGMVGRLNNLIREIQTLDDPYYMKNLSPGTYAATLFYAPKLPKVT